jgi:hypothetical protein
MASVTRLIFPDFTFSGSAVSLQSTAWRGGFWFAQAVRSDRQPS